VELDLLHKRSEKSFKFNVSHITLKYAIEKTIVEKIPEVNKVIEVKMSVV